MPVYSYVTLANSLSLVGPQFSGSFSGEPDIEQIVLRDCITSESNLEQCVQKAFLKR